LKVLHCMMTLVYEDSLVMSCKVKEAACALLAYVTNSMLFTCTNAVKFASSVNHLS